MATLSSRSKHKYLTPATFLTFVQSVLSGLPSTSSSTTESSSLTWLGGSLVDMSWAIDVKLNELVVESKSSEGVLGNEQQKNGEKDKQVVADLVKKPLVYEVIPGLIRDTDDTEWFGMKFLRPADKGKMLAEIQFHNDIKEQEPVLKEHQRPNRVLVYEVAKKSIVAKLAKVCQYDAIP